MVFKDIVVDVRQHLPPDLRLGRRRADLPEPARVADIVRCIRLDGWCMPEIFAK